MPVITTQSSIFNKAANFPANALTALRAFICGPQAGLHRYAVATEKSGISLGAVNPNVNTSYSYPGQTVGSIIDRNYTKLFIDACQMQYYTDLIGSGDTIAPVAGYTNRIRAAATVFQTANGVTRSAGVPIDVKVGDPVYLRGVVASTNVTMTTSVAGFIAEAVAATVGTSTAESTNQIAVNANIAAPVLNTPTPSGTGGTFTAGSYFWKLTATTVDGETVGSNEVTATVVLNGSVPLSWTQITGASGYKLYRGTAAGAENSLITTIVSGATTTYTDTGTTGSAGSPPASNTAYADPLTVSLTAGTAGDITATGTGLNYNGLATGNPQETYTITVTQGSVGGNATTALLKVTSASGNDNVASIAPSAFGSATNIGTRGLTVTFSHTSSDFVVGQAWQVTVKQNYTPPTTASGGTYTGASGSGTSFDTTYIVQCTRGGHFADATKPQITVTTTTGVDRSGPTTVSTSGSAVSIGTLGVTWTPTGLALNFGDKWDIAVTGTKNGGLQTIVLANNFPTTPQNLASATDLDLKLYVQADGVQITKDQTPNPPNLNWTDSSTNFTINANMQATNSRFVSGTYFPVASGTAYLEYREWLPGNVGTIIDISDSTTIPTLLGTVHPDNPLAYGVSVAMQNANKQTVRCTSVSDPNSQAAWQNVVNMITGLDSTYGIVPLTTNKTYLSLFQTLADSDSAAELGLYKKLWVNLQPTTSKVLVSQATSTDGKPVLATLVQDPSITGTSYTYLQVSGANANFLTAGVQAGDSVHYQFTTDGFGNSTYTTYQVASVVNSQTLILASGPASPVNTAQMVEIWHPNSLTEVANDLVAQAAAYNDSRVTCIWPDTLTNGTTVIPGYFGCAMAAGIASAVPPHQGLTNVQLVGATDAPRTNNYFSASQLKTLDTGGVWVIAKDSATGNLYTRHATTTNISTAATREEVVIRDTDGVLFLLLNQLAGYIGVTNVVDSTLTQMLADTKSLVTYIKQATFVNKLGAMIVNATITSLAQHATIPDRVVLTMTLTVPFPVDSIQIVVVV